MAFQSLDALREVDERTLRFTPHGLGVGVMMRPEDSARYLQAVVAQFELVPAVAEGTRMSFDRLKTIFVQGLFCYDIFTLVNDDALLVIEQALRDRFVDYHNGSVRFRDSTGEEHAVSVDRYEDVHAVLKNKKWRLVIGGDREPIPFNGTLGGLRAWARAVGLLRGQRNRGIERALSNLRNYVAHPTSYHLVDPWHTVQTLSDLAEIINQMWGCPTPGGRLYPAPIRREVVVLAWSVDGDSFQAALAEGLSTAIDPEDKPWRYAIVRAVFRPEDRVADPGLDHFDARYEATHFPADPLWGPGTLAEAAAWWAANTPTGDECEYLDRTFAIRQHGELLYLPMRPSVAAALASAERAGRWYVVRADFPEDAYHHVRTLLAGGSCTMIDECTQCPTEMVVAGSYDDVRSYLAGPTVNPDQVLDSTRARRPSAGGWTGVGVAVRFDHRR